MRRAYFLSAMLFTAVLCLCGIGVAAAEPQKNQIVVETTWCSNGQDYTFVINGMSKTGHVTPDTDVDVSNNVNVVVKQFIVEYFRVTGTLDDPPGSVDDVLVGSDTFESGNKIGLQGDLISCSGVAEDIDVQGLERVTAFFDFQAFVTPRGKA